MSSGLSDCACRFVSVSVSVSVVSCLYWSLWVLSGGAFNVRPWCTWFGQCCQCARDLEMDFSLIGWSLCQNAPVGSSNISLQGGTLTNTVGHTLHEQRNTSRKFRRPTKPSSTRRVALRMIGEAMQQLHPTLEVRMSPRWSGPLVGPMPASASVSVMRWLVNRLALPFMTVSELLGDEDVRSRCLEAPVSYLRVC